jgi:hypothetical protein
MGPVRDPLGTLDVNQPSTTNANAHASSSSVKLPLAKPVKLASIFTRPSRTSIHPRIPHEGESSASIRPDSPPSSSSPVEPSSPSPVRKRVKLTRSSSIYGEGSDTDDDVDIDMDEDEEFDRPAAPTMVKRRSMIDYFSTTASRRDAHGQAVKQVDQVRPEDPVESSIQVGWRRKRGRLGVNTSKASYLTALDRLSRKSAIVVI